MTPLWTFEPPFPEQYRTAVNKGVMLGAEPNGTSDPFAARDMGVWFRNIPSSGTRYARAIMSYAEAIAGRQADPRLLRPEETLLNWRIGDLSPEEAGPMVVGDFGDRVSRHLKETIGTLMEDRPTVVVLLGTHCQREWMKQVEPILMEMGITWMKRVGLPHPTLKTCGYFTLRELGSLQDKILPVGQALRTFSPRTGW